MSSDLKLEEKAGSLTGSTPSQNDSRDISHAKGGSAVDEFPIEVSGRGDLDIAAEFLKLHEGEHGEYTEAEAKEVLFKIDIWLVPMLLITVTLAAVDVSDRAPPITCKSNKLKIRKSLYPMLRSMV